MNCFSNDAADQCVYLKNNAPGTADWSDAYGANFHGCLTKSKGDCRAKAPEFTYCW